MASKKFKGKVCVYCTESQSDTADHVVSRSFFPTDLREGIPKVPACAKCNSDKAALEHYLSAFLPIGSTSDTAMAVLEKDIERRLERNKKLARELKFGAQLRWEESESGLILPGLKLPLNADFVEALFSMMGRGLIWHHYSELLDPSCHIEARALTPVGEKKFKSDFFPSLNGCVFDDIGNGGFQYVGRQARENPRLTMWLMRFYSGMTFSEFSSDENSQCMFVTSGPREVFESAGLAVKFGITT